jgi:hypothetical protein
LIIDLLNALAKYLLQIIPFLRYLLIFFPLRKFIGSPSFPRLIFSQTTKSALFLLLVIMHPNANAIPIIIDYDFLGGAAVLVRQTNFCYYG